MGDKIKVAVPNLKIRQEPRPDGVVLLEVARGTELELLEHRARYSRVRYADPYRKVEGYAANSVLAISEGGPLPTRSAGTMPLTCPACGNDEWKRLPVSVHGSALGSVQLGGFFDGVGVYARVCLACGYVMFFVPAEDLSRVQ